MTFVLLGILNAQAAGVAAGDFELLETQTLGTATSSVTFTGLDSYTDYKHLQIRMITEATSGSGENLLLTFNSDTGTNYARHQLFGNGSSVVSGADTSTTGIWTALPSSVNFVSSVTDILDFSSTSKNTTVRTLTSGIFGGSNDDYILLRSGVYINTNAITSLTLTAISSNIATGSRFSLYGIKAGA